MAEDVLRRCVQARLLEALPASRTAHFPLVGAPAPGEATTPMTAPPGLHLYGSEADVVAGLPGAEQELALGLTAAMVRFAVRYEYARTVEDILARRHRMLFLNAAMAARQAPTVAGILREEIAVDGRLADFLELARHYGSVPVPLAS
jgi:glycerol-3-phosphate dehydrogenase